MTVSVAVTGATGRMGREVLARAAERDDVEVAFAVNRSPDEDTVEGVPVADASDLELLLADHEPDILVDFTAPESSRTYVDAAAAAGVAAVVGTTGFDDDGDAALREASERVPVLHASNFARGVSVLGDIAERAVDALPEYDIELTETHHNGKRDAPSGTANSLLDRLEAHTDDQTHGRNGHAPRQPGEIGVHARRAGGVHGEHELMLAGRDEVLTITHRAQNRSVFASGALDAAVWLAGRDAGWYEFDDALGGDDNA